jgi:hypothetical protein
MVYPIIMLIARRATDFFLFLLMMELLSIFRIVDYPLGLTGGNISFRVSFSKVRFQ